MIELFPREFFECYSIDSIFVNSDEIYKIEIRDEREYSQERDPMYIIDITMKNGDVHEEVYENLTQLGICGGEKTIRDFRFRMLGQMIR